VLQGSEPVAFLPSTDLDRSERFFRDDLGLELIDRSPFACLFRVGPATLRVTTVDDLRPQPFTVFGWLVTDLRGTLPSLRSRGIRTLRYDGMGQDDDDIWTTPGGDRVAWFQDPDANVLSLTELTAP
jgi:catechol 2,3-dioxygenase-like lactoylglutathione lyase family enzyme